MDDKIKLPIIVVLALLVRGLMLWWVNPYYWYGGMSAHFGVASEYIYQGRGYASSRILADHIDREQSQKKRLIDMEAFREHLPEDEYLTMQRPPAYAVLLAGSYALTRSHRYIWAQSLQVLLDSLICLLLYWLLRPWGRKAGLAAAWLYALWPPMARNSVMILPEAFLPFLTTIALFFVVQGICRRRMTAFIPAGILLGISCYFRVNMLVFPIFFLPPLILATKDWRWSVRASGLMMTLTVLLFAPWLIRNYRIAGKFVLSTESGLVLLQGLGNYPDLFQEFPSDAPAHAELENLGIKDPLQKDAIWRQRFLEQVRLHPLRYLATVPRRFMYYLFPRLDWGFGEFLINGLTYADFQKQEGGGMVRYILRAPHMAFIKIVPRIVDTVIILVAIWGLILGVRHRWSTIFALAGVPFAFIACHSFIVSDARYVVPGFASYAALAAIALASLLEKSAHTKDKPDSASTELPAHSSAL